MTTQIANKLDYYKLTASKSGNFIVIDSIGVPHPYCITPRHVVYASDNNCGMLTTDSIQEAEEHGARCGICKGKLSYSEHEHALLISCKKDPQTDENAKEELHAYLLKLKDKAEEDGYAGFAFKKDY